MNESTEFIDLIFNVHITTTKFKYVSLHKLTQDLSWHFAVILQHDQRYLLAEALYFLWAFFLTLSDHREGSLKLRKCRLNIPHSRQAIIMISRVRSHTVLFFSFSGQRLEKKKKKKNRMTVNISE